MQLRNKNLECTVPRKAGSRDVSLRQSSGTTRNVCTVPVSVPEAPLLAPAGPVFMAVPEDEQPRFKLLVFRMPESLKTDFKMSLLKNHVDIQHTFEAFAEIFIAWANGEKIPDPMKAIIRRTITLMNGV